MIPSSPIFDFFRTLYTAWIMDPQHPTTQDHTDHWHQPWYHSTTCHDQIPCLSARGRRRKTRARLDSKILIWWLQGSGGSWGTLHLASGDLPHGSVTPPFFHTIFKNSRYSQFPAMLSWEFRCFFPQRRSKLQFQISWYGSLASFWRSNYCNLCSKYQLEKPLHDM